MTTSRFLAITTIVLTLVGTKVAQAAEFFVIPGTQTLLVLGVTQASDVGTIQGHIRDDNIDTLILRGPGGDLEAAFAISDLVIENQLDTVVPDDTDCASASASASASACAIIFVAGSVRELGNGARIGFHLPFAVFGRGADYNDAPTPYEFCRPFLNLPKRSSEMAVLFREPMAACMTLIYQMGLQDIRRLDKLFNRDGISEEVMDLMIETLPSDMSWVSHDGDKAISLGLHNAAG